MSVLYFAIPVALVLGLIAALTFVIQVKNGQFDDLETPAIRILFDDVQQEETENADTDSSV